MRKVPILWGRGFHAFTVGSIIFFTFMFCTLSPITLASNHYTEKQLEVLSERVGKIYWVAKVNNRMPSFLSAAAPKAALFQPQPNESFEIKELIGQKAKDPYYKVKFESGKEGYIRPEAFTEELNVTILSVDPQGDAKKKAAEAAEEDKKRVDWIKAQPWSEAVKEAALKRQPVPGMNTGEVKKVVGTPTRITNVRGPQRLVEEQWFYADDSVLVFHNGLLVRIEPRDK
jgi:hypothetical protein